MNLLALHQAIATVAPITGVSVGAEADRSTWRIDFADDATDGQRVAAHAALLAYVEPVPVREATYERLYTAIDALGARAAWDAAVAAAKPIYAAYLVGHYVDPIPENSSKLAKVAAAAKPAIDIKAVFDEIDRLTA